MTNAMRILDKQHISYETVSYDCEKFIDGLHMAKETGADPAITFKTLVMQGKSGAYYVIVIPVGREVDLKIAAQVCGEKSVELIPVKEITNVTGYVRGGCTPIGMKKQYKTYIHSSAEACDKIYISGGRIGTSLLLSPKDLCLVTKAAYADLCRPEEEG